MRSKCCRLVRGVGLIVMAGLMLGAAGIATAAENPENPLARLDVGKLDDAARALADAKKANAPDSPAVKKAEDDRAKAVQEAKDALLKERLPALRKAEAEQKALADQKLPDTDPKMKETSDRLAAERARFQNLVLRLAFDLTDDELKALGGCISIDLGYGTTLELVRIPTPGEFKMGPGNVKITRPFYLGRYEVTQRQWWAVTRRLTATVGALLAPGWVTPTNLHDVPFETLKELTDDRRPIEHVSGRDCLSFMAIMNQKYGGPVVFRLPMEAEWEYAARAGSTTKYFFGDDEGGLADYAWYSGNSGGELHAVGQKKPNPWGLYDIYGGVSEYCQDWWAPALPGGERIDPTGPASGRTNVIRGGNWYDPAVACSSSARGTLGLPNLTTTGVFAHYTGLRVVMTLPQDATAKAAATGGKTALLGVGLSPTVQPGGGLLIGGVQPGSAAEKAGLKKNDVIFKVEGAVATDPSVLTGAVTSRKPGDKLHLTVRRDGKDMDIEVTLGGS